MSRPADAYSISLDLANVPLRGALHYDGCLMLVFDKGRVVEVQQARILSDEDAEAVLTRVTERMRSHAAQVATLANVNGPSHAERMATRAEALETARATGDWDSAAGALEFLPGCDFIGIATRDGDRHKAHAETAAAHETVEGWE